MLETLVCWQIRIFCDRNYEYRLEGGYGIQPPQVAETVKQVIGIGVVGCNIEDLSGDPTSTFRRVEGHKILFAPRG